MKYKYKSGTLGYSMEQMEKIKDNTTLELSADECRLILRLLRSVDETLRWPCWEGNELELSMEEIRGAGTFCGNPAREAK